MYFPTVPKVLHLFDALPPIFLVIVTIEKFYVFLCATSSVNSDVPGETMSGANRILIF